MPVHTDIDVSAAKTLHTEPVDKPFGRLARQGFKHALPCGDDILAPIQQRTNH